ncbi:MAG TPA: 2-hydroxyhepta-2,4-diene-1,7-dioate isomerase [Gammaproteobacteria bacterium]|nr:2-hydroxyhepta-2,4-diene-1,7-dioate isomerase [Gammaproteobacteria bacterium]
MRHARIKHNDRVLKVTLDETDQLLDTNGQPLGLHANDEGFEWLSPVAEPGTIFALGLNYADHASELAFEPPKEPLVFLKHANCITGHKQTSYRPDNIDFQHYECELVAVIGKTGKHIQREDALDYVAGYTICNDFAIRDYLENYYRPNLRVKSRDSLMPLGPWLVDRDDVPDVSDLRLTTHVNGELTQEGTTRDMIFDVPFLIEYLSATMTLNPGDMIATGTPKGLKDMQPGDVVRCEVERIGALETRIVSEQTYYGTHY